MLRFDFRWVTMITLNFLLSKIHVFQQTFKGFVGRHMAARQEKKNPTNPRVWKIVEQYFFSKNFVICICNKVKVRYSSYFFSCEDISFY